MKTYTIHSWFGDDLQLKFDLPKVVSETEVLQFFATLIEKKINFAVRLDRTTPVIWLSMSGFGQQ